MASLLCPHFDTLGRYGKRDCDCRFRHFQPTPTEQSCAYDQPDQPCLEHETTPRCLRPIPPRASTAPRAELSNLVHPTRRNQPKPSRNCAKLNPQIPRSPAKHWTSAFFSPPGKIFPHIAPPTAPTRAPHNRTEPNKPERRSPPHSPRITHPHPEPHPQNPHITRQIWTPPDTKRHNSQPTTPDPPDHPEIRS